jgi:putative DNA primase/helicase
VTMVKGPDWNDFHRANPGAIRDAMVEEDIPFDRIDGNGHDAQGEAAADDGAADSLGAKVESNTNPIKLLSYAAATSEDRLAMAFTERHAQDLRYVAPWGKWFQWTGTHWKHERTLLAFDLARKICREISAQCNKASEAKNITRAKTVAAVEQLVKADRAMVATIEQWDANKDLLNTPGGQSTSKPGNFGRIIGMIIAPRSRLSRPAETARCSLSF